MARLEDLTRGAQVNGVRPDGPLCERKGWAQEPTAYNGLVTTWPELTRLASQAGAASPGQRDLFGGGEKK